MKTVFDGANLQSIVAKEWGSRDYTSNLFVLGLGLCEEAGEVAAAINDLHPDFQPSEHRIKSDLEHELNDLITYVAAIANAAGINLHLWVDVKAMRQCICG
jgi:NTP pyrophosphatase (non-canonical NTP hydrolase)